MAIERQVRLWAALIIAAYVVMHLLNHAAGLVSLEAMEAVRRVMRAIWGNPVVNPILMTAFGVHFLLALTALYRRSTLRMPAWEAAQLGFGLLIVPLILIHTIGTHGVRTHLGVDVTYEYVVAVLFVTDPMRGVQQSFMLLAVWIHMCVGLHFWLRVKPWYRRAVPVLYPAAVLIPVVAYLGFVMTGRRIADQASHDPGYLGQVFAALSAAPPEEVAFLASLEPLGWGVFDALVAAVLIAREVRRVARNRRGTYRLTLPSGKVLRAPVGQTVLETLRVAGVPHASVCGGRGRCTTCRIHVGAAARQLPRPEPTELRALDRIGAEEGVRLACQARPRRDISIRPLLPPETTARDANRPGGIQGREQPAAIMFVDLRGSTKLCEGKLPYDALFILNRFFAEMAAALADTHGHYAQFSGDGLMALYGIDKDVRTGCRDAILGAQAMLDRLDRLNGDLALELDEPLRIGIGIHCGDVIVGTMGPPTAQNFSAIGDHVNIAARLEAQTKQHGCALVMSAEAARTAGIDLTGIPTHDVDLRGRHEPVTIYAVNDPRHLDLPA
jgi:adenylate cyclase